MEMEMKWEEAKEKKNQKPLACAVNRNCLTKILKPKRKSI